METVKTELRQYIGLGHDSRDPGHILARRKSLVEVLRQVEIWALHEPEVDAVGIDFHEDSGNGYWIAVLQRRVRMPSKSDTQRYLAAKWRQVLKEHLSDKVPVKKGKK